jgi:hypothetical protein
MPNNQATTHSGLSHPIDGLMSLADPIFQRAQKDADQSQLPAAAGELMYRSTEIRDLKAELERLRAERDKLQEMQLRILELLGTDRPDRLIHDLRNVLNERALYRALAETSM